jgi:site-specific recombinase XerD
MDNRLYQEWCSVHGYNAYPSNEKELSIYMATMVLEGYKSSAILRRIASIKYAHLAQGYPPPNIKMLYSIIDGSKIALQTDKTSKKKLSKRDFKLMLDSTPNSLKGIRDNALLLLAYHSKMLREETVAINVEDLDFSNVKKYVRIRCIRRNGGSNRSRADKQEYVIVKIQ